jgi:hypothetical protein
MKWEIYMSWEDALPRMLPPTDGFQPHTTSQYGAIRDVGTMPVGKSDRSAFNPSGGVSMPIISPDASFAPSPQSDFEGRFGSWPTSSGVLAGFDQSPLGQPDMPNNEDWSAMWRRRTGRP